MKRKDEPVCETDKHGTKCWYINGERHREDGPAREFADGTREWYKNGEPYEPSAHELIIYKMKYEKKT